MSRPASRSDLTRNVEHNDRGEVDMGTIVETADPSDAGIDPLKYRENVGHRES